MFACIALSWLLDCCLLALSSLDCSIAVCLHYPLLTARLLFACIALSWLLNCCLLALSSLDCSIAVCLHRPLLTAQLLFACITLSWLLDCCLLVSPSLDCSIVVCFVAPALLNSEFDFMDKQISQVLTETHNRSIIPVKVQVGIAHSFIQSQLASLFSILKQPAEFSVILTRLISVGENCIIISIISPPPPLFSSPNPVSRDCN